MQLIVDLDGTICSEEKTFSRSMAKPLPGVKDALDKLSSQGFIIIIYSARSWNEYEMTIDWLNKNNIKYNQVILGKPIGKYWIDDRAIEFSSWEKILNQLS